MKRVFLLCFLVIGMMTEAQTNQIITKKLQLNNVPSGSSSDKILVRGGSDKVVKEVLRSSILPNTDFPAMYQGDGNPSSNTNLSNWMNTYLGRNLFYYDNTNLDLYTFDYGSSDWIKTSKGVLDAPIDGQSYMRKNGSWVANATTSTPLVYRASISLNGTSNPTALVYENTLGVNLNFLRTGAGVFYIYQETSSPNIVGNIAQTFIQFDNRDTSPALSETTWYLTGVSNEIKCTVYEITPTGKVATDFTELNKIYVEIIYYP